MRILALTHRLPYAPNRGDRLRAFHVLRALSAIAEVELISLVHDCEEEAHADDLRAFLPRVTTARISRPVTLMRAAGALAGNRPLTHALLHASGIGAALEQAVARRPDLVYAYCSGMARFAFEPPLGSVPVLLDLVDVDSVKWAQLSQTAAPPLSWIYAREARVLSRREADFVRSARATLVVNERERAVVEAMVPGAPVHVVGNGVDLAAYAPRGRPMDDPAVIFCGVMSYAPNEQAALWLLRSVWPRVRRVRPDARLVLLGAHPTRALQRTAANDPSVEVTGAVADVRPYLWQSAIAVAPLSIARGLQNKVLEAVAAGLPAVITPAVAAGLPDEVSPACAVAEGAEAFADAILTLLARSGAERQAMARRVDLRTLAWPERLHPLRELVRACVPPSPHEQIDDAAQYRYAHDRG